MRVLWVGDAGVSTGFARCTHAVTDHLHAQGHDVHVLGISYFGDPHPYPYPIYPCRTSARHDVFGAVRLPELVDQIVPDVVVLLNDPWNIPAYLQTLQRATHKPATLAWMAVDGRNQIAAPKLNPLTHAVCWTKFAVDQLARHGYTGTSAIVPLGVDPQVFYPVDRTFARRATFSGVAIPDDAYVVGAVGRNQLRKRLDLTIQYFAEWLSTTRGSRDKVFLHLHVAPTQDDGVDIPALVHFYGIEDRVTATITRLGDGIETDNMRSVYGSFDVCITTTQGEGWGLTTHEAMACGVPCIVPDWSALSEWPRDGVLRVPCTAMAPTAPLNSRAYTLGGIADRRAFVVALETLYLDPVVRRRLANRGREVALSLPWSAVGPAMEREIARAVVQASAVASVALPPAPLPLDVPAALGVAG